MGRKQHQSDKLYLTTQEWKYFFGGKKPGRATDPDEIDFKRLPFDHCSLSLQPFANPYCDDEVLNNCKTIDKKLHWSLSKIQLSLCFI